MTAEEQVRRTRICLAEIGPRAHQHQGAGRCARTGSPSSALMRPIPPAVGYQVARLIIAKDEEERPICCWSCYLEELETGVQGAAAECRAGQCRHPEGPALPPQELLSELGRPVEAIA